MSSPRDHCRTGESGDSYSRQRRRRRGGTGASLAINLAPMIDVTFLLLIFFLVTTTFERAEGLLSSTMPNQGSGAAPALPLSPIVVRLAQTGPHMDAVSIRVDRISTLPGDFDELHALLVELHGKPGFDKDTPVVIVAEGDVRWDFVVECWNTALRAGCTRVAFGEP